MILFICGIFKKKGRKEDRRKEEEKEERKKRRKKGQTQKQQGSAPGTRGEGGERQDRLWTRGGWGLRVCCALGDPSWWHWAVKRKLAGRVELQCSHTHTKVNKRPLCHLKCQSVLCHSPPFCHLCVCYSIVTANPVSGVKKQVRRPEGPFESLSTQLLSTLSFGCRGRGSLQSGSPLWEAACLVSGAVLAAATAPLPALPRSVQPATGRCQCRSR